MTFRGNRVRGPVLLGLLLLSVSSCKAGPSAFDRPGDAREEIGPEDTADVSTLPVIPDAPSVETVTVAEPDSATAPDPVVVAAEPDAAPESGPARESSAAPEVAVSQPRSVVASQSPPIT